jgi:hypothetical protein
VPERVLVFCKRSVAGLTASELVRELRDADLMTLAEVLQLPEGEEEAVRTMWQCFRLEPADASDLDGIELHWHAEQRPIQVRRGPPLHDEVSELLEGMKELVPKSLKRVREHLEKTVEVVEFELGIPGAHHLAATITEALAFFVAERGDGLVLFYHREFASPDARGDTLLSR